MTSMLGRRRSGSGSMPPGDGSAWELRLAGSTRVRRPVMAAGSIAMVFISIAVFVGLYARANHQAPIVVLARSVPRGQVISPGDLGEATASITGSAAPIPYAEASQVVGRHAAVSLVRGSVLAARDLTTSQQIPPGDAVVGVAVKDGQLPSGGLEAGDEVMVIQTAAPGTPTLVASSGSGNTALASTPTSGVLVPASRVYAVALPPANAGSSTTELVSLLVSSTLAPEVSVAAAADEVSLDLLPFGSTGS